MKCDKPNNNLNIKVNMSRVNIIDTINKFNKFNNNINIKINTNMVIKIDLKKI